MIAQPFRSLETLQQLSEGLPTDRDDVRLLDAETKPFFAQLLLMTEKEVVDRHERELKRLEDNQNLSVEERRQEYNVRKRFNVKELLWFHHVNKLKAQQEVRVPAVTKVEFLHALELVPRSPSKSATAITPTPATFTVSVGNESV
jgi:hypothetical protein